MKCLRGITGINQRPCILDSSVQSSFLMIATLTALITFGFCWGAMTASPKEFSGRPYSGDDVYADTWVATDALGRSVPG